jgi:hypothetical protein
MPRLRVAYNSIAPQALELLARSSTYVGMDPEETTIEAAPEWAKQGAGHRHLNAAVVPLCADVSLRYSSTSPAW